MKIIQRGIFDSDGIYVNCPYCYAVFLIEGREDFFVDINIDHSFFVTNNHVVEYKTICPSCKQVIYMGYIDEPRVLGRYSYLRNRKDWTERYHIRDEKSNALKEDKKDENNSNNN